MSASILKSIKLNSKYFQSIRSFRNVVPFLIHDLERPIYTQNLSFIYLPRNCRKLCSKPEKRDNVNKNVISAIKSDNISPNSESIHDDLSSKNSKLGLFARFKLMYKQYWYVLIPVHVVTSIGWFGGFYYLSKSGVDVPALLQTIHISDSIIEKIKGSEMGHVAIAYLLYKIATPVRYAVTLGGSTFFINYFSKIGYIKPVPSKREILQIYESKKADFTKRKHDRKV